jgi:phosphatidylserine/phosphatidylglycerophosphate/cardiolipin synthase-like enzyme
MPEGNRGMDDYLAGLLFLALAVLAFTLIELKSRHCRALQREADQAKVAVRQIQEELRAKEIEIDRLKRRSMALLKWKGRAEELDSAIREIRNTTENLSAQRLKYLEEYVSGLDGGDRSFLFVRTSPDRGIYSFEDRLRLMLEEAEFEIVIVSPWIKRPMWDRIKKPFRGFVQRGGRLRVFIRGCDSDYSSGFCDDISAEIGDLGGEMVALKQLHAKLYLVDRRQAIISSANLTRGGAENNYEAGIWLNDPVIVSDIIAFVEELYAQRS